MPCYANNSAKFRQTFPHVCSFILIFHYIFYNSGPKFTNFDDFSGISAIICTETMKISLDSLISSDFATNVFEISGNDFEKLEKIEKS